MIDASQRVDFLRDYDLAPNTWGAGRSVSLGCELNSREGAAIGCLSVCEAYRLSWTFNPIWESKDFFSPKVPHLIFKSPKVHGTVN